MAFGAVDVIEMEQRRGAVREAVLAQAERTVRESGPDSLKAKDLAAAAGCSIGVFYVVFKDMDAVAIALKGVVLGRLEIALRASAMMVEDGPEHAVDRVLAIARAYVDFAVSDPQLWALAFARRIGGVSFPGEVVASARAVASVLDESLAEIAPDSDPARRLSLGRAIVSALSGIVGLALEGQPSEAAERELRWRVDAVVSAVLSGLSWEGQRILQA